MDRLKRCNAHLKQPATVYLQSSMDRLKRLQTLKIYDDIYNLQSSMDRLKQIVHIKEKTKQVTFTIQYG